jgi:hypothetical protein
MVEPRVVYQAEGFRVLAAEYPLPDYEGGPWSQWGQGIVLADGRFLSGAGDHLGADGNSYLFEYDPTTNRLTLVSDVLSLTDHRPGSWGYGKLHAQMVSGGCGEVYVTTYWGSRRGLSYDQSYRGDLLLRIDPGARTLENLGVLVEERGVPSLAATPDGRYLVGEAVEPVSDSGSLVAFDTVTGEVIDVEVYPGHTGFRSLAVTGEGLVYFSAGSSELVSYDPASGAVGDRAIALPGDLLRAVTRPAGDGTLYAVTQKPSTLFAFHPDGSVETLGDAGGYTTSLALAGERLYWVADAHGGAWREGAPLQYLDIATGSIDTLLELNPAIEAELGLRVGGTYDVAYDPEGNRLYLGMNAATPPDDSGFGTVVLVIVELP